MTREDYDEVLVITGDEGTGKSRLMLHMLEWWKTQDDGRPWPEDITNCVGMDAAEFSALLRDATRHEIVINDEAADISSRSALSKTNKLFMLVYQLIRGENLFTILIIPSIFDLDTYFRKRRVRHLIHVPTRGKYDFWDKQDLRRMVEMNEGKPYKNYYRVRPTARGSFSDYKGVYLDAYLEKKADKMRRVREMIADRLKEEDGTAEEEARASERAEEQAAMNDAMVTALKQRESIRNIGGFMG